MPTAIRTEYAELDGVPLATAAWDTTSLLDLYDTPELRGSLEVVPYRRGALAFRRIAGPKFVTLPIVIYGDFDSDGIAHPDPRAGLLTNIDDLKRLIWTPPRVTTPDGNRLLRYHTPAGSVRSAGAQIVGPLALTELSPTTVRGALELAIPGGILNSETLTDVTSGVAPDAGFVDLVVPNPGTTYQDAATFILTGTATTAVKLTNLTADPGGDINLTFGGALGTGVTINSGAWTAVRAGISVIGLITYSGFESWLPLVPGNNTIRIEPTGGNATLQVTHYAPFT